MDIHATERNRIIGIVLISVAIITLGIIGYINSTKRHLPIVFSERELLENTWRVYKTEYLEPGTGRTLDKQQNNITTSEGQSYTMLRAVWMDDQETFDMSLKWTEDILKHKDDALHAWLFGDQGNGEYGILTDRGGQNSATDAEVDIAMSLIFAYNRWKDESYLIKAKEIINDIWEKEVVTIRGEPILAADDLEINAPNRIVVNPSYFAPYAYRMFAIVDPEHDWNRVVDSSYNILEQTLTLKLDKKSSAGIPPNWIQINRQTGEISAIESQTITTDFSYDALRIPWRIALDWHWYGEPRAKDFLDKLSFFSREWESKHRIGTAYGHDGMTLSPYEAPAMYGGVLGYFMVSNPGVAESIYEERLKILYNPDTNSWKETLSYYDDNWAWFGIGLYSGLLANLSM